MAEREFSRNQLDKLGERLLADPVADSDLDALARYRSALRDATSRSLMLVRTYAVVHAHVVTDRTVKILPSILRKLRDTTIGLGDMDDLVGCRIVVPNRSVQDAVRADLSVFLAPIRWIDRVSTPSSGYRAVHGVRRVNGFPLEVQIRTSLQDAWANLSESLADRFGQSVKYGGGPHQVRETLDELSEQVRTLEEAEQAFRDLVSPDSLAEFGEANELALANVMLAVEYGMAGLSGIRTTIVRAIDNASVLQP
jgi:ppGpp synthetase/RelA/SpoT-type nucleotidyltranferase